LEDCQRLNEFKENALQRAKDFELSKIVPIYENFYSEVIEKVKKGNISN
jgi:hypothetical protein